MCYIDGFIFAVENKNKQAFIDYANRIDVLFKEYGALRYMPARVRALSFLGLSGLVKGYETRLWKK